MKPGKTINGELPNNSHKGICADIKRLRGKFNGFPMKRGMFQGKPKEKKP